MSGNIKLRAPFLRNSWMFPDDNPQALSVQVDRAYLAIANNVNARQIGIYPTTNPIGSGKSWFVNTSKPEEGMRQVFTFTASGNIAHNLDLTSIVAFDNCYGSFTDGTNWYGVMYGSNTAIAGQISFYITGTNIVVLSGAGAPAITSGVIVLEWRSQS